MMTPLQKARASFKPVLPDLFNEIEKLEAVVEKGPSLDPKIQELFPHTATTKSVTFKKGMAKIESPHRVGVLFSGGQAPGGHNVVIGLFDALKKLNKDSELIGFLGGPSGLLEEKALILDEEKLSDYRNQGGFDLLGSGRTKIETSSQFIAALKCVERLNLDGLVIIGGDDSNTNAGYLAEFFAKNGVDCSVVGVPKTIDGDLKNSYIPISFGFDTATKVYCESIGNILRDILSAKKQYAFIRLMGRSASHITLECALQTHPNAALISENCGTLQAVVDDLVNLVVARAKEGKKYGAILIPEGLVEFIPGFKELIEELNHLLEENRGVEELSKASFELFHFLPSDIQKSLLMERDPHGNVQVSKIETERLLISLVEQELVKRDEKISFSPQPYFLGYEGRAALPTNFDANYCTALGFGAALAINQRLQGYIVTLQGLALNPKEWRLTLLPLSSLFGFEKRGSSVKAVIQKALVDISGKMYKEYFKQAASWRVVDDYRFMGPIQFFGPDEITNDPPLIVALKG